MSFEIKFFSVENKHIDLKSDGSIELTIPRGNIGTIVPTETDIVILDYHQSKMLKRMILAEHELEKK